MAEEYRHTLNIDKDGTITLSGVTEIVSLTDSEAVIMTDRGKTVVRGSKLSLSKLDKEQGRLSMTSEGVSSVTYGGQRRSGLKSLFS